MDDNEQKDLPPFVKTWKQFYILLAAWLVLLIADYGKGKFVYTSLVFFRELPAGVPGAYRLFANLLAPKQQ